MSGVYIPNVNLPERCDECPHPTCRLWQSVNGGKKHEKCPIVPVPDHGRLVDADALLKKMEDDVPVYVGFTGRRQGPYAFRRDTEVYTSICGAPTVIPADKEAET